MRKVSAIAVLLFCLATPAWAADQDRLVIRDEHGRRTGTVERGVGDRQVIRDEQGRRVGTIEPGVGGRQIIRDEQGRRVGEVERR